LELLGDIDANFAYTGVSGFDNYDILEGRPYGGCAIMWRSDLKVDIVILPTDMLETPEPLTSDINVGSRLRGRETQAWRMRLNRSMRTKKEVSMLQLT
jgi:hypothetical protein